MFYDIPIKPGTPVPPEAPMVFSGRFFHGMAVLPSRLDSCLHPWKLLFHSPYPTSVRHMIMGNICTPMRRHLFNPGYLQVFYGSPCAKWIPVLIFVFYHPIVSTMKKTYSKSMIVSIVFPKLRKFLMDGQCLHCSPHLICSSICFKTNACPCRLI